jgi:hypothetical protein
LTLTEFRGTIHVYCTNRRTRDTFDSGFHVAIKFTSLIFLMKEAHKTEIGKIFQYGQKEGMFLWCKNRKRSTGVHVKELTTNSCTMAIMRAGPLRTLLYEAEDTV